MTTDTSSSFVRSDLMIKVLLELEKGQDSPWFPWFNSLPRYYTNAASMTPVSPVFDFGIAFSIEWSVCTIFISILIIKISHISHNLDTRYDFGI